MAFWGVRAGRHGEDEAYAIENSIVVYGEREIGELDPTMTRAEHRKLYERTYPGEGEMRRRISADPLWNLAREMKDGDLVALPRKTSGSIAFGRVTGPYQFEANAPATARHRRPVSWVDTDYPRLKIEQDIRFSLGSTLTVFQVRRNNAEERMRAALEGRPEPKQAVDQPPPEVAETQVDIERQARDRIIEHIGRKFRTYGLERLIEAILRAQGFITDRTPPGADGGVDILAGRGQLGFEPPRIAVQVKSSDSPVDVGQVRELQGVMRAFSADLGLFVAWGGFRGTAPRDARRDFFQLRLWNSEDVLDQVLAHYDRLPSDIQAELPLKRVWTLVQDDPDQP